MYVELILWDVHDTCTLPVTAANVEWAFGKLKWIND